ncbi:MAG: response regulator [Thermoplasmata archaeon]
MEILLVDDEAGTQEQAKYLLEKENEDFDVTTLGSADDALELLDDEDFDVIVSDYRMPETDGIEFLETLRDDDKDIPFIILTGKGREEVVINALNLGADRYLRKSKDPQSQYDLLSRAIRQEYKRKKTEIELKENKEKIEELHDVASQLISCETEDEAYELVIDASERILNFDLCSIEEVVDDKFKTRALTSKMDIEGTGDRSVEDGGLDKKTYLNKEKFLIEDARNRSDAKPVVKDNEFRSTISLPIGEFGIFQAISTEPGYFGTEDMKMSELLLSHLDNTITRIRSEREIKKKEKLYRTIFENTGTAMVIINDDLTISLSNEEFNKLVGYYEESVEGKEFLNMIVKEDKDRLNRYHKLRREDPEAAPNQYDAQIVTQHGDKKHVVMTVGLINDTGKSVASLLDVSNREEIQKHYEKLHSKDFKENQERAKTYLELLEDTDMGEEQRKFVDKIKKALDENTEVIEEIQNNI